MRTIKLIAATCFALSLAGPAFAQGGGNSNDVEAATSGPSAGQKAGGMKKGGATSSGGASDTGSMQKGGSMQKESPGAGPSAGGTTGSPTAPTGR